ncbi:alpha/beta hydrolase [Zavarzinia sp. CC-PAN008]|uniref:alpha/beta hydrolase n=1 Tax=Zavarzinia sp. CC-PAN008 TaxID=3243332 RepID=UPI003F749E84
MSADGGWDRETRPPVLLIHGAFCGGWAFDGFADHLRARGWRCAAPTLRYHDVPQKAPSPPGLGRTSLRDYADDVAQLVHRLDRPPILIGHSMGGLVAQLAAMRVGVAGLVLLAPSPSWGMIPSTEFEVASAFGMLAAGAFWHQPVQPMFRIAAEHSLDRLPRDQQKAVFSRFVPESGQAIFEIMYWALDMSRAAFVDPGRISAPVLAIAGGRDRINTTRTVRRIAQRFRNAADFQEYPDNSHWLLGEPGYDEIAEDVHRWMLTRVVV